VLDSNQIKETASVNATAKEIQATPDLDQQLKVHLKARSTTQDYDFFPHYLEKDVERFPGRLGVTPGFRLGCSAVCDFILRGWRDSFESMARSLAEARAETARYYEKMRQKELNEEKLRSLATRSRLNALISQINPHFLFNALNTVGVLIEENPEEARRLTIKMANIFRQTLRASEREMVSLHEELSFIQDYLEIEKARFGERLRVEQTVAVTNAEIPCFTVQLLIENAIKHGASPKVGTTTIRILALQVRDRIQIQVSDDGVGMPKDALDHILERGYGLRNLIERLNILYASDFSWHVESEFQKGTAVSLQLPFFPASC
jgi:LytS/YehU family sensor histidine kinase